MSLLTADLIYVKEIYSKNNSQKITWRLIKNISKKRVIKTNENTLKDFLHDMKEGKKLK